MPITLVYSSVFMSPLLESATSSISPSAARLAARPKNSKSRIRPSFGSSVFSYLVSTVKISKITAVWRA